MLGSSIVPMRLSRGASMKLRLFFLVAALVVFTSAAIAAQTPAPASATTVSPELTLPVTTRGQTITVYGVFPTAPVKVNLRSGKPNDKGIPIDAAMSDDTKSVTFKVPADGPVAS